MQQHRPAFAVIGGRQVAAVLAGQEQRLVDLVARTYLAHHRGATVNPPSHFLTFPDRPRNRIIALPASLGGSVDGIKWISSVPANPERGIPRASAVTILNDPTTGFPYACLESSVISATRTAASAALAARVLGGQRRPRRLGIVGSGLIARYVYRFLTATGPGYDEVLVCDQQPAHAEAFAAEVRAARGVVAVRTVADPAEVARASDLLVLTTVAPQPYLLDPDCLAHGPLVLNISLRDLGADVVLAATQNVVDDVDHCLRAGTSVHLAEQQVGHRRFVAGTLSEVLEGRLQPAPTGTIVFSPFGLGVLDLAVARLVYDRLAGTDGLHTVPGFFELPAGAELIGAAAGAGES